MKISDLRLETRSGVARAAARVSWEDCGRPTLDLFFETEESDAAPEPEAFLTACILPAMRGGEKRVWIEGSVCRRLADNAASAIALLRRWHGPPRPDVSIEPSNGFREIPPRRPERAALYFTGGIDSMHLLHTNRAHFPREHPDSFAEGISVYGHLCPTSGIPKRWNEVPTLRATARDAGLGLVAVRTNIWELAPNVEFLAAESLSSALASAAHLFRGRWSRVSIASARDCLRMYERGNHPLLDPFYSSGAIDVRHASNRFTRFERLRTVATCPRAIENLVVCLSFPPPPYLNCGTCEKCVRTMTALLAIGKLSETKQFPERDVRPEQIRAVHIGRLDADYWIDLLAPLEERRRADLAAAIRDALEETRRERLWMDDAGWKGSLRRLDRRLLGGRLLAARRRILPKSRPPADPSEEEPGRRLADGVISSKGRRRRSRDSARPATPAVRAPAPGRRGPTRTR